VVFGTLWFLLMLLPSVTMLVLDIGEPMAEQRVYLAGAGFAMATGAAFGHLREWPPKHWVSARAVATAAFGVFLVGLASRTVERNNVWSDPVRLWTEAVSSAPDIWVPHRGLGDALRERGDYRGASEAYREAARLRPQEVNTHLALGVSLMMTDRVPEAYSAFAEATRLSPGLEQAEIGQAAAARLLGRTDESRDRFLGIVKAHPDAVLPRLYLAEMYERDYADPATALRLCREVQTLAPQTAGVADCISRNQQRVNGLGQGSNGR
jgi:tetratricopeptide (TPR) repeat protein